MKLMRLAPIALLMAATTAAYAQSPTTDSSRRERMDQAYQDYKSGGPRDTSMHSSHATGSTGSEKGSSMKRSVKNAGQKVENGAERAGGAVKRGATRAGHAVSNAAAKADRAIRSKVGNGPSNPAPASNNPTPGS